MSTVQRTVVTIVLVSMVIYSSLANDLQDSRCKWNSKWRGCGTCCQSAHAACATYCVSCPLYVGLNHDPCFIHEKNKLYMKYFSSKGCHQKCGMSPQKHISFFKKDAPHFFSKMNVREFQSDDNAPYSSSNRAPGYLRPYKK